METAQTHGSRRESSRHGAYEESRRRKPAGFDPSSRSNRCMLLTYVQAHVIVRARQHTHTHARTRTHTHARARAHTHTHTAGIGCCRLMSSTAASGGKHSARARTKAAKPGVTSQRSRGPLLPLRPVREAPRGAAGRCERSCRRGLCYVPVVPHVILEVGITLSAAQAAGASVDFDGHADVGHLIWQTREGVVLVGVHLTEPLALACLSLRGHPSFLRLCHFSVQNGLSTSDNKTEVTACFRRCGRTCACAALTTVLCECMHACSRAAESTSVCGESS